MSDSKTFAPPRDDLYRMYGGTGAATLMSADEARAAEDGGDGTAQVDGGAVMEGHFAVFDQWTEISSFWEGNFLERIAPGAFTKTFAENLAGMRALFQHGMDPVIAEKPLGPIRSVAEDKIGARYEVPLLDTAYNGELIPGLRAQLYGASFRFQVILEELFEEPDPSEHNPRGLPERTIKEARVMEFGPVTFPAYAGATAGLRSITDDVRDARILARDMKKLSAACRDILKDADRLERAQLFVTARAAATVPTNADPDEVSAAPEREAETQHHVESHLGSEGRGEHDQPIPERYCDGSWVNPKPNEQEEESPWIALRS